MSDINSNSMENQRRFLSPTKMLVGDGQRTGQFLIERWCPSGYNRPLPEGTNSNFPFPAWVYLEEISPGRCGGRSWRMTADSVHDANRHFRVPYDDPSPRLCEHMGHLIE